MGTTKIRGVDRVEGELLVSEALAEGLGLFDAVFGQGRIGVALPKSGAVPFGFAMADEVEFGHFVAKDLNRKERKEQLILKRLSY